MGVPLNHPFSWDFSIINHHYKPSMLGYPPCIEEFPYDSTSGCAKNRFRSGSIPQTLGSWLSAAAECALSTAAFMQRSVRSCGRYLWNWKVQQFVGGVGHRTGRTSQCFLGPWLSLRSNSCWWSFSSSVLHWGCETGRRGSVSPRGKLCFCWGPRFL